MDILGYFAALVIGLSLGLIGGGGSILTVPVLVYIFGIPAVISTSYSLFVVGCSSLIGAIIAYKKKNISVKTAILFSIPSIISVYLTRLYILPIIPESILSINNFIIIKDTFIMSLFTIIMIGASIFMIIDKKYKTKTKIKNCTLCYFKIVLEGLVVGILTGLVGAGGGFLIIPALVIFAKLPMKVAVGTSLLIISNKSIIGFIGDLQNNIDIDWKLLSIFTLISFVGIFIGFYLSKFISGSKLKKSFGYFVLTMAIIIIYKEFLK